MHSLRLAALAAISRVLARAMASRERSFYADSDAGWKLVYENRAGRVGSIQTRDAPSSARALVMAITLSIANRDIDHRA